MTDSARACRRIRSSGVASPVSSGVLLLVGAVVSSWQDMRTVAAFGVGRAIAAVAVIVVFI
jgi:hypothetical protein